MKILALDTATDHGSMALSVDGEIVWERHLHSPDGFSHILFKDLHDSLAEGVCLEMVDIFAAASGPGSFTGVRVGLATVKGLAEALQKGALGVSNLQALASFGTEPRRAVLIDARRQESYAAVYDENLALVSAEIVGQPQTWIESLPEKSYQFVSQNDTWLESLLLSTRFAHNPVVAAPLPLASAIARCASLQIKQGLSTDPVALDANYVRRSDVNLYWHDRRQ